MYLIEWALIAVAAWLVVRWIWRQVRRSTAARENGKPLGP